MIRSDSTSRKGDQAVAIIKEYLKRGGFPLMMDPAVIDELDMQIEGTDIIIDADIRVQCKCDYSGGPQELGGTGNLFLQVEESNPWKQY